MGSEETGWYTAEGTGEISPPQWPHHPRLRQVAEVLEEHDLHGQVLDDKWRVVYRSRSERETLPEDAQVEWMMRSVIRRQLERPEWFETTPESAEEFTRKILPQMLHDVPPGDPTHEEVFASLGEHLGSIEPIDPPLSCATRVEWVGGVRDRHELYSGPMTIHWTRLYDGAEFAGVLLLILPGMEARALGRMVRGDALTHELMDSLREPTRRAAGILFCDLEGSGPLARQMSSTAYFRLIRTLRDLIDESVTPHGGLVGKHAGDGASVLFLPNGEDREADSDAVRRLIDAAQAIRGAVADLDTPGVAVNMGLHWGATLTVGQISTSGRLEVTAIGDEMNECARIEAAATEGAMLASKNLIERLTDSDAKTVGINPDEVAYRTVADLVPDGKIARDAGQIPVTNLIQGTRRALLADDI